MGSAGEFKKTYVDKCRDFLCEPVKPLLADLDEAKLEMRPLDRINLNGNSNSLFNSRLEYMQLFALAEALHNNLYVTELDLSFNTIDDAGAAVIARLLKVNRRIIRVDLTSNHIGEEGAVKLVEALAHGAAGGEGPGAGAGGSEIAVLKLNGNPIGDAGGLGLAAWLRTNEFIEELDVGNCNLGVKSVVALMAALSEANRSLKKLNIENPRLLSLGDEHNMHTAHMLATNDAVVELKLGKVRVRDQGAETLVAYGLIPNNTLTTLDLRCCDLTEVAGASIARLLYENYGLTALNLSGNRLADNGAAAIAAVLPEARSLLKLDLSFNSVKDRGLVALAEGVRHNGRLSRLLLWGNVFGRAGAQAFADAFAARTHMPLWTDFKPYPVDENVYVAKITVPTPRFK